MSDILIRAGERRWLSRGTTQYHTLSDLKTALRNDYPNSVFIKIIKDHTESMPQDLKHAFTTVNQYGINSLPTNTDQYFIEIIFSDDATEAKFIMDSNNCSNSTANVIKRIGY